MRAVCRHVAAVAVVLLVASAGCGSKTSIPATPDAAFNTVTKGLAEDKPEVVWQALPESYQKDVNDVLATAAKGCDPDVYNQSFGIAKKVVLVLQQKKDLILTHPQLAQSGVNTQQLAQHWDAVVNLVSIIVNSDLSDLNKVKNLDCEKVLSTSGSQFMKSITEVAKMGPKPVDIKAKLTSMKATQVKTEGDTVICKLEVEGEEPKEEPFKKVEGKWIPKDMADNWKSEVAKAKANIEKGIAQAKTQNKEMTLSQLKVLDGVLDQVLAAKTAEEFNNAVMSGAGAVMGLAAPLLQANGGAGVHSPQLPTAVESTKPAGGDGEEKDNE